MYALAPPQCLLPGVYVTIYKFSPNVFSQGNTTVPAFIITSNYPKLLKRRGIEYVNQNKWAICLLLKCGFCSFKTQSFQGIPSTYRGPHRTSFLYQATMEDYCNVYNSGSCQYSSFLGQAGDYIDRVLREMDVIHLLTIRFIRRWGDTWRWKLPPRRSDDTSVGADHSFYVSL